MKVLQARAIEIYPLSLEGTPNPQAQRDLWSHEGLAGLRRHRIFMYAMLSSVCEVPHLRGICSGLTVTAARGEPQP